MTTGTIIVLVILGLLWVWIAYEIHIAPELDDDGNIKIDITEEDINNDLYCLYEEEGETESN